MISCTLKLKWLQTTQGSSTEPCKKVCAGLQCVAALNRTGLLRISACCVMETHAGQIEGLLGPSARSTSDATSSAAARASSSLLCMLSQSSNVDLSSLICCNMAWALSGSFHRSPAAASVSSISSCALTAGSSMTCPPKYISDTTEVATQVIAESTVRTRLLGQYGRPPAVRPCIRPQLQRTAQSGNASQRPTVDCVNQTQRAINTSRRACVLRALRLRGGPAGLAAVSVSTAEQTKPASVCGNLTRRAVAAGHAAPGPGPARKLTGPWTRRGRAHQLWRPRPTPAGMAPSLLHSCCARRARARLMHASVPGQAGPSWAACPRGWRCLRGPGARCKGLAAASSTLGETWRGSAHHLISDQPYAAGVVVV